MLRLQLVRLCTASKSSALTAASVTGFPLRATSTSSAARAAAGAAGSASSPAAAAAAKPVVDGLTRYPQLSAPGILRGLDYYGTTIFAASGAVTAATAGMDLFGATAVGLITAVGGGTFRDGLFLHKQPFWLSETEYLYMAIAGAAAAFFAWPALEKAGADWDMPFLVWSDAIGLGAFACIGVQNALRMGMSPIVCLICAISTATFGGLTRDTLCQRPHRILYSHADLYASTAVVGGTAYLLTRAMGGSLAMRILMGVACGAATRLATVQFDLHAPAWPKKPAAAAAVTAGAVAASAKNDE